MNSLLAALDSKLSTPPTEDNNEIDQLDNNSINESLSPKRRRRTSKVELALLEAHFKENHLPTVSQRAKIASQVGLSVRATQVWFQNRRQKGKKVGGSGEISHPNSAPDGPSSDARSNSSTSPPAVIRYKPYIIPKSSTNSTTKPSNKLPILTSSQDIYAGLERKDIIFTAWSPQTLQHPVKPIITSASVNSTSAPTTNTKVVLPLAQPLPKTTEIIKLGSEAPKARKPELVHEFLFPPSPVKLPTPPPSLASPTVLSFPFPSSPRAQSVPITEPKRPSLTEFITRTQSVATFRPSASGSVRRPSIISSISGRNVGEKKLKRKRLARSHSLGGLVTSTIPISSSTPNLNPMIVTLPSLTSLNILKPKNQETSRAGPNETCALSALGRKRDFMDFSKSLSSSQSKKVKKSNKENSIVNGARSTSEPFKGNGKNNFEGVGEEEREAAGLLLGLFSGMF